MEVLISIPILNNCSSYNLLGTSHNPDLPVAAESFLVLLSPSPLGTFSTLQSLKWDSLEIHRVRHNSVH